jgi:hypothetical protein
MHIVHAHIVSNIAWKRQKNWATEEYGFLL